jgi:TetR/AcrR family transcriptional repressor of nem operon
MTRTKDKLLASAETCFLAKGYNATTVDEICQGAGATKGAFFHYFRSKQEAALAAVERHAESRLDAFMRGADRTSDVRQRPLAYLDRMVELATSVERPACLVAALTLEMADVEAGIRSMCLAAFDRWQADLVSLLQPALRMGGEVPDAETLARQIIASFEGALVLARARRDNQVVVETMALVRRAVEPCLVPPAKVVTASLAQAELAGRALQA